MMSKEDVLAGVRAVLPGPDESVLFPLVDVDGDEVGKVCIRRLIGFWKPGTRFILECGGCRA